MKMTSQLVTLVLAVFVCSAAVVYSQSTASPPTVPAASITTPRPPVATNPPPVDNGTPAPSANGTDAPAPVVTDAPMTSAKHDDDDGMKGDGDTDGQEGHDEDKDEEGGGGLRRGDIALAILATILVVAVICTFTGLCYWKYKGNSYVTVTADTTYRQ